MSMKVKINKNIIKVKTLTDEFSQSVGMMGKKFDKDFNGLLFLMGGKKQCFWMKNCLINLDIIMIKNNKLTISFPDNAEYIIDMGPKKVKDIMSQQSVIYKRNGKLLVKPVTGGSVIIEPFFTVVKRGF